MYYAALIPGYDARTQVKPGMTGWAQVNGHRGATETTASMAARVEHDLWYIRHWSLWLDLIILLRTLPTVLVDPNAY